MKFDLILSEIDMFKRFFVFWVLAGTFVVTMLMNSGFDMRRFLDPDFLWIFASIFGLGVLGFAVRQTSGDINILVFRRIVRGVLVIGIIGYLLFAFSQPRAEFDPQSLLPEEGTDWFSVAVNIFAFYFGAWALIAGLEKRIPNLFVFFDPTFYQKVEKAPKKKPDIKK